MAEDRTGQTVVMFISERTRADAEGYAVAAAAMAALAAQQPGFCGMDHVSEGSRAITLSYWADEASAIAWRQHPEHTETREAGRGRWYASYMLHIADIGRSYAWTRP
ncbi:MAG: antibiotic biosynthesis monooxygenase [Sphingomonadales bacterium]|nr:MAG: antibiotic biosynthesis monooxygenase [Sphingomonadales bacterium]